MTLFNLLKTYNFTQLSFKEIRRLIEVKISVDYLQLKDNAAKLK
tara:strand:- start:268 stop:399 length:132 start_codon:yes stop_codon:yes gene_type:complete